MRKETTQVNKEKYFPIYNRIPEFKKRECVTYLGFRLPCYFTNRKSIDVDTYNKLLQFMSHYDLDSPNTIKEYLPFDSFDLERLQLLRLAKLLILSVLGTYSR